MFPEFSSSKILIHISFHYNESNFPYLRTVLNSINNYSFEMVDVVIDTNGKANANKLTQLGDNFNFNLLIYGHENLAHPFELTWTHRRHVSEEINNYQYFMYLEDDIEVTLDALECWRTDSEILYINRFLRGFLRTEVNSSNEPTCCDQFERAKRHNAYFRFGRPFLYPDNPYQAFWIYSKIQMLDFVQSPSWIDGNQPDWGIRERAAAGMSWREGNRHNVLIPLDSELKVPTNTQVRHLSNRFANKINTKLGKLPVTKLTSPRVVFWFYLQVSKIRQALGL